MTVNKSVGRPKKMVLACGMRCSFVVADSTAERENCGDSSAPSSSKFAQPREEYVSVFGNRVERFACIMRLLGDNINTIRRRARP